MWWEISIVFVVAVLVGWGSRGDVVSVLSLLLGRLEGVSRYDVVIVVALEECASLVSSIFFLVLFLIEKIGDC